MSRPLFAITFGLLSVVSANAWADDSAPAKPVTPAESAKPTAAAPTAASAPASTDAKPAAAADAKDDSVLLHVSTPERVTVERSDTGQVVCTSPCDKNVPVNGRYRIGTARPSQDFSLAPSAEGRADVKVKPGSKGQFWMGVGLMGLGAGLIAGGAATLLYWTSNKPAVQGGDGEGTDSRYTYAMMAGTGLVVLGAVSGIWGTASVVDNLRSKVRGNVQEAKNSNGAPSTGRTIQLASGLPKPVSVPIFGGTF